MVRYLILTFPKILQFPKYLGRSDLRMNWVLGNTYKFTKLYSGTLQFVEEDIFKTIIPLNDTITMKLGPTVSNQVAQSNVEGKILEYCKVA